MLVELRQAGSDVLLDRLQLDAPPPPGRWVELNGMSYLVMQRRHRYQLRNGRYQISPGFEHLLHALFVHEDAALIESIPPRTAFKIPSVPCAWLAQVLWNRCPS